MAYDQVVGQLGQPDREQPQYTYSAWVAADGVSVIASDPEGFIVAGKSGVWLPNSGDEFLFGTRNVQFDALVDDLGEPQQTQVEQRYQWEYADGSLLELGFIGEAVSSMTHYHEVLPAEVTAIGGRVPGLPAVFNPVAICDRNPACQENLTDIGQPPSLLRFRHSWRETPQADCAVINQASQSWVSLYHLITVLGMPDGEASRSTRYVWNRGDGRFQLQFSRQDQTLAVEEDSIIDGSAPAFGRFKAQFAPIAQQETIRPDDLQTLGSPDRMELIVDYLWRYDGQSVEVVVDQGRVVGCSGVSTG